MVESSDAYEKLAAPLLNRFEKQVSRTPDDSRAEPGAWAGSCSHRR